MLHCSNIPTKYLRLNSEQRKVNTNMNTSRSTVSVEFRDKLNDLQAPKRRFQNVYYVST
jgi:hypothetical protein